MSDDATGTGRTEQSHLPGAGAAVAVLCVAAAVEGWVPQAADWGRGVTAAGAGMGAMLAWIAAAALTGRKDRRDAVPKANPSEDGMP